MSETPSTRFVTRTFTLAPDHRAEALGRAREALKRLPDNYRDKRFCRVRTEWAEQVARAFPDMSRDEIREALVERFGVAINGTKLTAAMKRAKAAAIDRQRCQHR